MKISCSVFKRHTFPFTLVSVPTNTYRKNLLQCYNRLTVAAADRDHLTTRIASSTADTGTLTTDTSLTHLTRLVIHITAMPITARMATRRIILHTLTCIKMRKESTKVLIRAIGILLIFEETLTIAKGRCLQNNVSLNCKHRGWLQGLKWMLTAGVLCIFTLSGHHSQWLSQQIHMRHCKRPEQKKKRINETCKFKSAMTHE